MTSRILSLAFVSALFAAPVAMADDDLVLLPGQGEIKTDTGHGVDGGPARLAPGGGLLMSFDDDANGLISADEIEAGIVLAFALADANEDGNLTPLEQTAWANDLPTRDDTLANPARFDPNLDRNVSLDEFTGSVRHMAAIYADEDTGVIVLASLEVQDRRSQRPSSNPFDGNFQQRGQMRRN